MRQKMELFLGTCSVLDDKLYWKREEKNQLTSRGPCLGSHEPSTNN